MKHYSLRWASLYRCDPGTWTKPMLAECTLDEIEGLCRLMGIPYSGPKDRRIERLLDAVSLRKELATWGEYEGDSQRAHAIADAILTRYTRPQLVRLARRAKAFYSLKKRGIIVSLLQWRDGCRRRGQAFNRELQRHATYQLALPLPELSCSNSMAADGGTKE